MSDRCAVAADTKIETPEGPLTATAVARTPCAVLTRSDDGAVRFAMVSAIEKVGEAQPVLRVRLDNGRSFRVGPGQVLFRRGMSEVRAADLARGDELEALFMFPDGYVFRAEDGSTRISRGALTVAAVEAGGESDVYSFSVARTGLFALSAGVLARAGR